MVIDFTLPAGVSLHYLSGPILGRWEAMVRLRLDRDGIGTRSSIRYAVGFGTNHNPSTAISLALDALDRDPQIQEQALVQPTCAPEIPDAALANLLTPAPMTPSAPKFKLKA